MAQSKHLGMVEICDFLGPFLKFSVIRVPFSPSLSMFVKDVITSLASMCCLFPLEAMPVIKLLMECLKYIPGNKDDVSREY